MGTAFGRKFFTLEAYAYIFKSGEKILRAYGMTILVTVIGTTVHLTLSALFAYPLAVGASGMQSDYIFCFLLQCLLNGGLVPSYMMWTSIFHIKEDDFWSDCAHVFDGAMKTLLIRTFFPQVYRMHCLRLQN